MGRGSFFRRERQNLTLRFDDEHDYQHLLRTQLRFEGVHLW
jgi:hypothetical protein